MVRQEGNNAGLEERCMRSDHLRVPVVINSNSSPNINNSGSHRWWRPHGRTQRLKAAVAIATAAQLRCDDSLFVVDWSWNMVIPQGNRVRHANTGYHILRPTTHQKARKPPMIGLCTLGVSGLEAFTAQHPSVCFVRRRDSQMSSGVEQKFGGFTNDYSWTTPRICNILSGAFGPTSMSDSDYLLDK